MSPSRCMTRGVSFAACQSTGTATTTGNPTTVLLVQDERAPTTGMGHPPRTRTQPLPADRAPPFPICPRASPSGGLGAEPRRPNTGTSPCWPDAGPPNELRAVSGGDSVTTFAPRSGWWCGCASVGPASRARQQGAVSACRRFAHTEPSCLYRPLTRARPSLDFGSYGGKAKSALPPKGARPQRRNPMLTPNPKTSRRRWSL